MLAPPSFAGFQKASINLKPNFDPAHMLANIDHSLASGLPVIGKPLKERKERLLIVGNGPSVEACLGRLRMKARRKTTRILAVNGAHRFLLENGITPWAHLIMDASPIMAPHVPEQDRGVRYLFATMVHPDTLKAVEGRNVYLWHAYQGLGEHEHLHAKGIDDMLVCGGCTAALRSINLGYLMGFRQLELYGVDSCVWGDRHHANQYGEAGAPTLRMKVGDVVFQTTGDMAKQAQDFEDIVNRWDSLFPGAQISVHGHGIIVEMMRQRNQKIEARKQA